jgi:flagellar assembly factor FliW
MDNTNLDIEITTLESEKKFDPNFTQSGKPRKRVSYKRNPEVCFKVADNYMERCDYYINVEKYGKEYAKKEYDKAMAKRKYRRKGSPEWLFY